MGYKQNEYIIPSGWTLSPLNEIAPLQRGFDLPTSQIRSGPYPVVYSNGVLEYHDQSMVKSPGVVTGRSGTIGKVHFIEKDYWPHNTSLWVTSFCGNDPKFIYYLYTHINLARLLSGSGVPTLNRNDVHQHKVACPPPTEQRAIAEVLSDVDGLLAALDALIAKKRVIKKAAMQQLLSGKTRLPGFSGEWETKRLRDIAELHRQNVVPVASGDMLFMHFSLPAYDENQRPVIEFGSRIGSNKFQVPDNAVLVSKLNPRIPRVWAPASIGSNAVASTEFMVLTPRERISRSFLFILCSSPEFCEQMELLATGTTGSHQRISPSEAMKINVWLPMDSDEQAAIAAILSDMDAEIAALERRRDKARTIKQGMMQQLLTGRMRLVKPE